MGRGEEPTSTEGLEKVIAKGIAAASNIPEISRTAKTRLFTPHPSTNAFPETTNNVSNIDICPHAQKVKASFLNPNIPPIEFSGFSHKRGL